MTDVCDHDVAECPACGLGPKPFFEQLDDIDALVATVELVPLWNALFGAATIAWVGSQGGNLGCGDQEWKNPCHCDRVQAGLEACGCEDHVSGSGPDCSGCSCPCYLHQKED